MCGSSSKSSSSTASSQVTDTVTGTATGTVGDVIQGETVNVNFPQQAVDVFRDLTALVGNSIDIAAQAGTKALDATNALATSVKQPDVAVIQGSQDTARYALLAVAAIGGIILFVKR